MLHKVLTDRRRAIGMSIDELVEKSGVPKGTLTKVLTGVSSNPALETVKAIAYAMGMSLNELDNYESKEISDAAMRLALIYDSLNEAGRELIDQTVAFAEKNFKNDRFNPEMTVICGGAKSTKDQIAEYESSIHEKDF